MNADHTVAFAAFWTKNFAGLQCPPLPKKESDLNLTALLALRAEDPALFQNLFGQKTDSMPADTVARRNLGQCTLADADHLERAGLQWEAEEIRRKAEIEEQRAFAQRIDESRQLQAIQEQRTREWQESGLLERMAASPVSAEAAARARAQWGITGQ